MKIPEVVCGSHNCPPFWFHLCSTTPFVPFFLHFDNWAIYRINRWHRSELVSSSVKSVDRLWNSNQSIFLERNKIGGADLGACEMPIPLLEFLFFHPFNRLFDTNSDFRINAMHLHRPIDESTFYARGLLNCVTFDFTQPRNLSIRWRYQYPLLSVANASACFWMKLLREKRKKWQYRNEIRNYGAM